MSTKARKTYCHLVGAVLLLLFGVTANCQIVSVSVPDLHLRKAERIIGLELHVHSGRIAQLPNIPIGWTMSVENDPSWNTVLKGSIRVGGAAADPEFLAGFVVIQVEPDAPSDSPFGLQGEIIVTSDFKSERKIKLSIKNFVMKGAAKTDASKIR
jgi:hypothetical protein